MLLTYILDGISEDNFQINICKIKNLEKELLTKNIICDFSNMSFAQLQFEYSKFICISDDKVLVNHSKKFLPIIKKRTKFSIEPKTKEIVIELWEK